MALKVVAGSVPMATATSMRSSRMRVMVVWLRVFEGWRGGCASGGEGHEVYAAGGVGRGGAEAVAHLLGGYLLALPVHAGGFGVVDLHAVHAYVALAGFGVAGDDAGEGDEAASVLRPGLEDGELEEVDVCAAMDDLLAGGVFGGDDFGEEAAYLGERGKQLELVHEAGWGFGFEEGADAVGYGVEGVGFEGEVACGARCRTGSSGRVRRGGLLRFRRGGRGLRLWQCRGGAWRLGRRSRPSRGRVRLRR